MGWGGGTGLGRTPLLPAVLLAAAPLAPALALSGPHGAAYPPVPLPPGAGGPPIVPPGIFDGPLGGPKTPKGPTGPPGAGPRGPTTPAPGPGAAPGGAPGPSTRPGGGPDLNAFDREAWDHWWNFNRAPFLDLRSHIHDEGVRTGDGEFYLGRGETRSRAPRLAPDDGTISAKVVPALLAVLEEERSTDMLTAALMALGKIGRRGDDPQAEALARAITPFLADANQELAETAAVALGILGRAGALPTLVDLARDTPAGRQLLGTTEVPYRTRAFAIYGLGLAGRRGSSNELRQGIAEHLVELLESPRFATRDVKVAAMTALGLVPLDGGFAPPPRAEGAEPGPQARHVLSRRTQLAFLADYFVHDRSSAPRRHELVRAHAATAIARLLPGAPEGLRETLVPILLAALHKHSKEPWQVQASTVLALGRIADGDGEDTDAKVRGTLVRLVREGHPLVRRFALMALARIGSRPGKVDPGGGAILEGPLVAAAPVRRELVRTMVRGPTRLRPWAALALGVLGHGLAEAGVVPDGEVTEALRRTLADCRRPQDVGAYALAVGLRRDAQSREVLLDRLEYFSDPSARGHVIVGLGLLGDRRSIRPIAEVLASAKYKPELLWQAAVGLGLLGDKDLVPALVLLLRQARGLSSQAALAAALGTIGDVRSIDPLLEMLADDQHLTDTARAFALVSLGLVCDGDRLPWNHPIADGINYLAGTSTLSESGRGILDIL